jgi:hypothetical protein
MADATLRTLFSIGFLARFSYALARNPVLPLFAAALGAGPEGIGLAMGISTVTGIFFKMPSGVRSSQDCWWQPWDMAQPLPSSQRSSALRFLCFSTPCGKNRKR